MAARVSSGGRLAPTAVRSTELHLVTEAILGGRSVLITGPAGIGKTRTLADAIAAMAANGRRTATLTATAAMSVIPLGTVMSMIDDAADPAAVPGQVDRAIAVRRGVSERRLDVLAIDDAHLLDAASAGVIWELASGGLTILAAARSGHPLPDAITLLVKDGGGLHCELPPLSATEIRDAVVVELGGDADAGLLRALEARSRGNPLALRALLREGMARGVVMLVDGSWRLHGRLPIVEEVVELMRLPVDRLSPPARHAAELVALADGLPLEMLVGLSHEEAIDEAESATVLDLGRPGAVRVGHPLIGDALLAMLPTLRRRSHLARLIAVLDGSDDPIDRVAVARWSIELERDIPPGLLLELAERVLANDPETSEFLLRAAVERGAGTLGLMRLAELLAHQHRPDDSRAVLESIDLDDLDAESFLAVQMTRAFLLIMPAQLSDEGLELLAGLRERFGSFPMLEALTSTALWRSGQPEHARDRAASVIDDPMSALDAVTHALLTAATLRIYDGDAAGFAGYLPRLRELAASERASLPEGEDAVRLLTAIAPLYSSLDLDHVSPRGSGLRARARPR